MDSAPVHQSTNLKCTCCHKQKTAGDFYLKSGKIESICKECKKQKRRNRYQNAKSNQTKIPLHSDSEPKFDSSISDEIVETVDPTISSLVTFAEDEVSLLVDVFKQLAAWRDRQKTLVDEPKVS